MVMEPKSSGAEPRLKLRLATSAQEVRAAQRLRYRVFVEELGGTGALVDHDERLERDRFDPFFDHLVLFDEARGVDMIDSAVGVYRVMRADQAEAAGGFYSEDEFDISVLRASNRRLLELGRSCVDPAYRGGTSMYHLWNGLADYVADHDIDILFGTASFHGTDVEALSQVLSFLHHNHLAPTDLCVRALEGHFQPMDLIADSDIDHGQAKQALPTLIKAYLRLGGFVGEGAFIDQHFNTTDVCLVMDTETMGARYREFYSKGRPK